MNPLLEVVKMFVRFPTLHEGLIGRVAIVSSRMEYNVSLLFGFTFNLKNEQWRVITQGVRSIQAKIDILVRGLAQEVCALDETAARELQSLLKSLAPFIELRNNLIHGQIIPDMSRILEIVEILERKEISNDELYQRCESLLKETICVSRFNSRTSESTDVRFDIKEVDILLREATEITSKISAVMERVKDKFDWVPIRMPQSDLRKLAEP